MAVRISKSAPNLPSRVVLYASEKFGKSSFGCYAPRPIFQMTSGETGLLSLIESRQVPETDHFEPDAQSWDQINENLDFLLTQDHKYSTYVLDTGNGCELLCQQYVCREYFGNNWQKYASYGKGNEAATREWGEFLGQLDRLRVQKKMAILFLHHCKVKTFSNPEGEDYDQFKPESVDKLWALTHKWADIIIHGGFHVSVDKDERKAKGGRERVLRTQASAAVVAGNRYGLPAEIRGGNDAKSLWTAFASALAKCKGKKPDPTPEPPKPPTPPEPEEKSSDTIAIHEDSEPEPEEPGDAYEPEPSAKISPSLAAQLIAFVHEAGLDWPFVRRDLCSQIGIHLSATASVTDLTNEQAEQIANRLQSLIANKQTRSRKAGVA